MDKNQKSALDSDLFEEFRYLYFDDYEYLATEDENREKNKKDFLAEKIDNPSFNYPLLDSFDFESKKNKFIQLKEKAKKNKNQIVTKAYIGRIDEMLEQIEMLKAAKTGDDLEFTKQSVLIYGKPSPDMFEYDKKVVSDTIKKALESESLERATATTLLQKHFPDLSYNKLIEKDFDLLPKLVKNDRKVLKSTEIRYMFEKAVKDLDLNNWKVKIDKTGKKTNLSANQETKTVSIPNDDNIKTRMAPTTETNIKALINHELGTHAKRRENGEKSKLKLLGLGLDRFLKGEEGLASFEYQKIQGASYFAGFGSHFSVSIGVGLDGKKRNFREVFEILKLYFLASIESDTDRKKQAEDLAWNTCVRCFRGTTCKTPGSLFTKGHVYSEGNIGIYKLITSGSKEVERFMVGKYDPTNKNHVQILDALGIWC